MPWACEMDNWLSGQVGTVQGRGAPKVGCCLTVLDFRGDGGVLVVSGVVWMSLWKLLCADRGDCFGEEVQEQDICLYWATTEISELLR